MTPDEFWGCTIEDIIDLLVGALWRKKDEAENKISLAWNVAKLNRAKRLPRLKKLIRGEKVNIVKGEEKKKLQNQHQERLKKMGVEGVSSDVD